MDGARVLLDEVEVLDWDEKLVVARVLQLHELLQGLAYCESRHADELGEAMLHMDYVIPNLEVS